MFHWFQIAIDGLLFDIFLTICFTITILPYKTFLMFILCVHESNQMNKELGYVVLCTVNASVIVQNAI